MCIWLNCCCVLIERNPSKSFPWKLILLIPVFEGHVHLVELLLCPYRKEPKQVLSMEINSAYSRVQKLELWKSNTLNDPKSLCFSVKLTNVSYKTRETYAAVVDITCLSASHPLLHRGAVDVVAVVSANGLRGGHLQPDPLLPLCGVATIVIDHTQGQASNQVPIVLSSREEGIRMHRHRQVCVNPRQRILKQEWGIPSRSIVDRSARVAEAERPTSLLDHDRISRFCKFYSSAPLNSRRCHWRPSPSLPTASTPPPIVTIGAPSLPYRYSRPQLLPSSFSPLL
ncbi:hypothetical protein GW17_00050582 [Ensete ventricosum]|nr:hypothetical protein GW17_00050582 [Ensete ventricosum]